MSPNDLALKLAQAAPQHVAFDDVIIVADALATLGYSFEPPGVPGRYHEFGRSAAQHEALPVPHDRTGHAAGAKCPGGNRTDWPSHPRARLASKWLLHQRGCI